MSLNPTPLAPEFKTPDMPPNPDQIEEIKCPQYPKRRYADTNIRGEESKAKRMKIEDGAEEEYSDKDEMVAQSNLAESLEEINHSPTLANAVLEAAFTRIPESVMIQYKDLFLKIELCTENELGVPTINLINYIKSKLN